MAGHIAGINLPKALSVLLSLNLGALLESNNVTFMEIEGNRSRDFYSFVLAGAISECTMEEYFVP